MELPEHLEPPPAWGELCAELRRAVGESTYEIWLSPLKLMSWERGRLELAAPPTMRAWVTKRFGKVIETVAHSVLGEKVRVTFANGESSGRGTGRPTATLEHEVGVLAPSFNPRYSFDQFIIGDGNRLAHAAALAVAELPGQAYNPLFLHAPPGLGKTHLLHAIGNYVLAFGGGATVRYTTVEAFTNHFITALGSRSLDRFKHVYRGTDVLLIDDVQFLASKAKTEEEFFHTFNALYETGRQLVLTCDRLPRQLAAIGERLLERFEAGLVADIRPPDFDTRVAILYKRALLDRVPLGDPAVLELIAKRVTTNIRALEGALIRIVAYHSLAQRPIDVGLATTVLDTMYPESRPASVSIAEIQSTVASHYEVTVEELVSPSREKRIAWPRQVAIHLARQVTHASLQDLGDAFGKRSHATVLHACRQVSKRLAADSQASGELVELTDALHRQYGDRAC